MATNRIPDQGLPSSSQRGLDAFIWNFPLEKPRTSVDKKELRVGLQSVHDTLTQGDQPLLHDIQKLENVYHKLSVIKDFQMTRIQRLLSKVFNFVFHGIWQSTIERAQILYECITPVVQRALQERAATSAAASTEPQRKESDSGLLSNSVRVLTEVASTASSAVVSGLTRLRSSTTQVASTVFSTVSEWFPLSSIVTADAAPACGYSVEEDLSSKEADEKRAVSETIDPQITIQSLEALAGKQDYKFPVEDSYDNSVKDINSIGSAALAGAWSLLIPLLPEGKWTKVKDKEDQYQIILPEAVTVFGFSVVEPIITFTYQKLSDEIIQFTIDGILTPKQIQYNSRQHTITLIRGDSMAEYLFAKAINLKANSLRTSKNYKPFLQELEPLLTMAPQFADKKVATLKLADIPLDYYYKYILPTTVE